jgi:hypothetical protein
LTDHLVPAGRDGPWHRIVIAMRDGTVQHIQQHAPPAVAVKIEPSMT